MDESLEIKSIPLKDWSRYYNIFQKKDSERLASTGNRRSKLMEAAHIPEDEVWNRLQSTCAIKLFVYHVENHCYKKYVLKKTQENIILVFVL